MTRLLGFAITILVLLAMFVAVERTSSPLFKECLGKHQDSTSSVRVSLKAYVECTGDFLDKNNGSVTALATIVIAAFTATLWRTTTAQFELAREAFIADKRAFVFASGITAFYEPDPATGQFNWRVGPVWQNSGDTPTSELRLYTDGFLSNISIPATFDFTATNPAVPPGPGMLGPKMSSQGGQAPHLPNSALTPQDVFDIQQGRKFFYLWGWARYRDTLPTTPEHVTRYCWRIMVTGDPFTFNPAVDPSSVRFFNLYEPRGNCADEECRLQGLA
jgi:hypothetical protein